MKDSYAISYVAKHMSDIVAQMRREGTRSVTVTDTKGSELVLSLPHVGHAAHSPAPNVGHAINPPIPPAMPDGLLRDDSVTYEELAYDEHGEPYLKT